MNIFSKANFDDAEYTKVQPLRPHGGMGIWNPGKMLGLHEPSQYLDLLTF